MQLDDKTIMDLAGLAASNVPYEKQVAAVQSLMPMMNGEQRARLTRIIELLKK